MLYGFERRLTKQQPLAVPTDIKRYFVTPKEAAQLCTISCFIGKDKEIFFPKTGKKFKDISLLELSNNYLKQKGFEPKAFYSEASAKKSIKNLIQAGKWPCFYFKTDTTGEKKLEKFYAEHESVILDRFQNIGVVKKTSSDKDFKWNSFEKAYNKFKSLNTWNKVILVNIFKRHLSNFNHSEKNKNLDEKM